MTDRSVDRDPQPKAPTRDLSGKPVNVVQKDVEHPNPATHDVDQLITPTSTKEKEQDVETLESKLRQVERALDR